jgi:hypothetical protein
VATVFEVYVFREHERIISLLEKCHLVLIQIADFDIISLNIKYDSKNKGFATFCPNPYFNVLSFYEFVSSFEHDFGWLNDLPVGIDSKKLAKSTATTNTIAAVLINTEAPRNKEYKM